MSEEDKLPSDSKREKKNYVGFFIFNNLFMFASFWSMWVYRRHVEAASGAQIR